MLYVDGVSLFKIKEEIKENLLGKKINRVFKNNEYSLSLHFGKQELLFSCLPNFSICYLNQNKEKPILDISSSIIENLRKHLMNAMLIDIEQLGFDRILVFHFSKINELGEIKKHKLIFECLGKFSNIIFCNEYLQIIDSFKKFYISEKNDRTFFYGEKYTRPKYTNKISPFEIKESEFKTLIENKIALSNHIEGIGKIFEESINFYENSEKFKIYTELLNSKKFKIYFNKNKIKLATVLDISYLEHDELKTFDTFNDMINYYVNYEEVSTSYSLLKNRLIGNLEKKIKKFNRTLLLIEEDIEKSELMKKYKEEADILASVLYLVKKGMTSIKTFDFYNNKDIEILLDMKLNPKENLENLYKKYNKLKRGLENALRRKKEVNEEIDYIESSLLFIENAKTVSELREIEEELIKEKYITPIHSTKKTKLKKEMKYGIYEYKNSLILYGRNNLENDNLTLKIANKNDYWFHAKNLPSSHIIVKTDNLNDELIKLASQIVAKYTKINIGEKLEVDYTQKKYVKKPSGAKPGFVIYSNYNTYLVDKIEIENI